MSELTTRFPHPVGLVTAFPGFAVMLKLTVTVVLNQPPQDGPGEQLKLMSPPAAIAPDGTSTTKSDNMQNAVQSFTRTSIEVSDGEHMEAQSRCCQSGQGDPGEPQIPIMPPVCGGQRRLSRADDLCERREPRRRGRCLDDWSKRALRVTSHGLRVRFGLGRRRAPHEPRRRREHRR